MHYTWTLVRSRLYMHPARVVVYLCVHVHAYTCLCDVHGSVAVMDGVLCCSTGAISQPGSGAGHLGMIHHAGG